uniref:Uncharacterized protein n=1 Tax=uncultured marine virus TaxID=186617 RepID=A0A0F7L6N2_9VIRU|nr:hypothetical protein [uncultured marine virus]
MSFPYAGIYTTGLTKNRRKLQIVSAPFVRDKPATYSSSMLATTSPVLHPRRTAIILSTIAVSCWHRNARIETVPSSARFALRPRIIVLSPSRVDSVGAMQPQPPPEPVHFQGL